LIYFNVVNIENFAGVLLLLFRCQGVEKPFKDVIFANIGDCHACGQKPITFLRQVDNKAVVTTIRFNFDSTAIRLRYDRETTYVTTCALAASQT